MTTACKIVASSGQVTQLDKRAVPDQVASEGDVQDPTRLARTLTGLLKDIAALKKRYAPRRIDFEDQAVSTAGAAVTLRHAFNGRVRWYLVGWQSTGTAAPILKEDAAKTTTETLVLLSYVAGTATIRVEEAG